MLVFGPAESFLRMTTRATMSPMMAMMPTICSMVCDFLSNGVPTTLRPSSAADRPGLSHSPSTQRYGHRVRERSRGIVLIVVSVIGLVAEALSMIQDGLGGPKVVALACFAFLFWYGWELAHRAPDQ